MSEVSFKNDYGEKETLFNVVLFEDNTLVNMIMEAPIETFENYRALAQYYSRDILASEFYEPFIDEIEKGRPVFMLGSLYENGNEVAGQAVVAYGLLEINNTYDDDRTWVAIKDTLPSDSIITVRNKWGDRLWVQDGGEIKKFGYDTVKWWPTPDDEGNEILSNGQDWRWEGVIFARPIQLSLFLTRNSFNNPTDFGNIVPIANPLGKMEIVQAPEQLGIDEKVLHLFTPDGSPIGFGLNTILPEYFEIGFKYAGLGDGTLQLKLDDDIFKEIDFNSSSLDKLVAFDETFNSSALGIEAYSLHFLSFILKAQGDPELYLNDLFVRNLNARVTSEPVSMFLFGLGGLAMAAFKRKKKHI